jgi:hypothetical protein
MVPTYCTKKEYWWEFVVWLKSLILHPKNTKLGKSGIFRSLEIAKFHFKSIPLQIKEFVMTIDMK